MNSLGAPGNRSARKASAYSVQTDPIAPLLLGGIERLIGCRDGLVGSRLPVRQDRGDADADGDVIGNA